MKKDYDIITRAGGHVHRYDRGIFEKMERLYSGGTRAYIEVTMKDGSIYRCSCYDNRALEWIREQQRREV